MFRFKRFLPLLLLALGSLAIAGLDEGLVGHVPLTSNDQFKETVSNTTPSNTDTDMEGCPFDEAADFDGNDYLEYTSMTDLAFATSDFSISFWAYRASAATSFEHMIWYRESSTDFTGYSLDWQDDGDLAFRIDFGTLAEEVYVTTPETGKWHHYAATADRDGDIKMYFNGVLVDTYTLTSSASIGSTNSKLMLGAGRDAFDALNNYTTAKLDEVRFYDRVLEAWEISDLSQSFEGVRLITEDITLDVPSDYADINAALACLDGKHIDQDATVTIQVADGTYNNVATITVDHPDGARIQLLGDTADKTNVVLNIANSSDGIVVTNGTQLGMLNGFTINGGTTPGNGVTARRNSSIVCGSQLAVADFVWGVLAEMSSSIECNSIDVDDCSSVGLYAVGGSHIWADNADIDDCGFGVRAEGAFIRIENGSANSCTIGYNTAGGDIRGKDSSLTNNTTGANATYGGHIDIRGVTFSGNTTNTSPAINAVGNDNSMVNN